MLGACSLVLESSAVVWQTFLPPSGAVTLSFEMGGIPFPLNLNLVILIRP